MPNCLRCQTPLENVTPTSTEQVRFFSCPHCHCQYTQNEQGRLFDRWLMPLTVPLYMILFEKEPLTCIERVASFVMEKPSEYRKVLLEHIDAELSLPTQRLSDIHKFSYANEQQLREFLAKLRATIADLSEK